MTKLLEFILKSIVNYPQEIEVVTAGDDYSSEYKIKSNEEDRKIIIGKKGSTISSIRQLLRLAERQSSKRVLVTVED